MSSFETASPGFPRLDTSMAALGPQQAALIGAMSPLWLMFMGASTLGMAYWGMTRWMSLAAPQRFSAPVVKLRLVKPVARPALAPVIVEPQPEPAPADLSFVAEAPVPAAGLISPDVSLSEEAVPVKKAAVRKPAVKAAPKKI